MKEWADSNFKFYDMYRAAVLKCIYSPARVLEALGFWEFFFRMRCTKKEFAEFLDWKDRVITWIVNENDKNEKASTNRIKINYNVLYELEALYYDDNSWLRRWLVNDVIYEHLKVYFDWQDDKVDKLEVNGKILTREELENVEDVDLWHFIEN